MPRSDSFPKMQIAAYVSGAAALLHLVWGSGSLFYRIASYRWIPLMVLCFLSIPSPPRSLWDLLHRPPSPDGDRMLHSVSLCVLVTAGYCLVASLMIRTYPGIRFSAFLMIGLGDVVQRLPGAALRSAHSELTPETCDHRALAAAFITHLVYSRFIPGKPRTGCPSTPSSAPSHLSFWISGILHPDADPHGPCLVLDIHFLSQGAEGLGATLSIAPGSVNLPAKSGTDLAREKKVRKNVKTFCRLTVL